jgi:hypothetical protein
MMMKNTYFQKINEIHPALKMLFVALVILLVAYMIGRAKGRKIGKAQSGTLDVIDEYGEVDESKAIEISKRLLKDLEASLIFNIYDTDAYVELLEMNDNTFIDTISRYNQGRDKELFNERLKRAYAITKFSPFLGMQKLRGYFYTILERHNTLIQYDNE